MLLQARLQNGLAVAMAGNWACRCGGWATASASWSGASHHQPSFCLSQQPRSCLITLRAGDGASSEQAALDAAAPAVASPGRGAGASGGLMSTHGSGASTSTQFHSPAAAADAVQAMRATLAALHQRMHEQQAAPAAAASQGPEAQHEQAKGGGSGTRSNSPAPAAAATITASELESLHT